MYSPVTGNPCRDNPFAPEPRPLPHCPNCGAEIGADSIVHRTTSGDIFCDNCTTSGPAYEIWPEAFEEDF